MKNPIAAVFPGHRRDKRGLLLRIGRDERGASLVAVMALTTAVLLIGYALFIFGTTEHDLVTFQAEEAQAFYLAEAGVQRTMAYLTAQMNRHHAKYPASGAFTSQALGEGEYTATFLNVGSGGPSYVEYEVVSMGEVNGVRSEIHATIGKESFAKYLWFTDESDRRRWFTTNDVLDGLVHSNEEIRINGDPWFGDRVTTHEDELEMRPWSHPTFVKGYELDVEKVRLPKRNKVRSALRRAANSGGLKLGRLHGSRSRYEIVLGRDGAYGFMSYRTYRKRGHGYVYGSWVDVNLATLNGAVWADEPVWLEGTLDGRVTIGSKRDISITGDLLYLDSTPGSGPDPGCDDMLGIISRDDVIVARTTANDDDCEIHAAIMALHHSFEVEDASSGSPRGDLIIYGSITQEEWGRVCTFETAGSITHGYSKKYYYDTRMKYDAPPFFPVTGSYLVKVWGEVPASS